MIHVSEALNIASYHTDTKKILRQSDDSNLHEYCGNSYQSVSPAVNQPDGWSLLNFCRMCGCISSANQP